MSYWPHNFFKNHNYKRLNTLDDDDKLFSVNTEDIKLETRNEREFSNDNEDNDLKINFKDENHII